LRGLFELSITYLEDDALVQQIKELAVRLGGDPEAMFFGGMERRPGWSESSDGS